MWTYEELKAALDDKKVLLRPKNKQAESTLLEDEQNEYKRYLPLIEEDKNLATKCKEVGVHVPERFYLNKDNPKGMCFTAPYEGLAFYKPEDKEHSWRYMPYSRGLTVMHIYKPNNPDAFPGMPLVLDVQTSTEYKEFREAFMEFHTEFRDWLEKELTNKG